MQRCLIVQVETQEAIEIGGKDAVSLGGRMGMGGRGCLEFRGLRDEEQGGPSDGRVEKNN